MKQVLLIVLFFFLASFLFSQNKRIDSLKIALKLAKEDTNKINILNNLSFEKMVVGDYNDASVLANKGLQLSKKLKFFKGISNALNSMGRIHRFKADYVKSLDYHFNALEIATTQNYKQLIANSYGDIGIVFAQQHDNTTALVYFEKALDMYKKIGDKEGEEYFLGNIGSIYYQQGEIEKALNYYLKALKIAEEQKNNKGKAYILGNIAAAYTKNKEYSMALEYNFKSLDIRKKLKDKKSITISLYNIGCIYFDLKKYKETEDYFLKAAPIASELKDLEMLKNIYDVLSELYENKGNWELSLSYHKKYSLLKDSIYNTNKSKQIAEIQTKYETKEKVEKINFLKQQNEFNQLKIKREQQLKYLILLFCGGIGITGYLGFRNYKRRQKLVVEKTKIIHEKEQIEAEKEIIELEQKMLLLQMNPHFIFNSLNSIKSFIIQNKSTNALHYLEDFSKLIRLILISSRRETIKLDEELQLLSYYLKLEQVRMGFSFDFEINLSKDVEENQELLAIPPMFIQPFIENALQHGLSRLNKKGSLVVNATIENELLQIVILDNGIGRKKSELINSVERKKHESLAIKIIDERIEAFRLKYNQVITVVVEDVYTDLENTGTKIILSMPIINSYEQSN